MRVVIRVVVGIAALLNAGVAVSRAEDVPVYTVCEVMKDLPALNDKAIVVVGRLSATGEGTWLDQTCPDKLVTNGYTWSTSISLSYVAEHTVPPPRFPKGFHWNKVLVSTKLAALSKTTSLRVYPKYHYSDKWMAVFGRLETKFPLDPAQYPCCLSGGGHLAGFGHLNGSPAQLVWPPNGFHKLRQQGSTSQVTTVHISGRVTDRTGAPIPNAGVKFLAYGQTETTATVQTDTDGRYKVEVAPGSYQLSIEASGFSRAIVTIKAVPGMDVHLVPVVMEVGELWISPDIPYISRPLPSTLIAQNDSRQVSGTVSGVEAPGIERRLIDYKPTHSDSEYLEQVYSAPIVVVGVILSDTLDAVRFHLIGTLSCLSDFAN